jgi:polyisoprenoid-binding protein YceI
MTTPTVDIPGYVAGRWQIDPLHSEVSFTVRHLMISKVHGRFRTVEGVIVTTANPAASSVTATIDLASVDTGSEHRDEHLRSADFLDVASHPTMTYRSTGLRPDGATLLLDGDLTLRGVTKPVTLRVEATGFGSDTFGGTRVGFTASGEINRNDFGVSYNGPVPGGGVAISERVQIALDIQAVLQQD